MKWIRLIKKLPLALILVAVWGAARLGGVDFSPATVSGIVVIMACFVVFTLEFIKSGDITLRSFGLDQAYAVLMIIVGTCVMTILVRDAYAPCVTDALIALLILCDGWVSPFNSFRTALRNWSAATVSTETINVGSNQS